MILKDFKLPVIDKPDINSCFFIKEAIGCDSQQCVYNEVIE